MKQINGKVNKQKPLWFWGISMVTGKGCMFCSENLFTPKPGITIPKALVDDEEGNDWVVVFIFDRQLQRLLSVFAAFEHFADGQPGGGLVVPAWLVLERAMQSCVENHQRLLEPVLRAKIEVELARKGLASRSLEDVPTLPGKPSFRTRRLEARHAKIK